MEFFPGAIAIRPQLIFCVIIMSDPTSCLLMLNQARLIGFLWAVPDMALTCTWVLDLLEIIKRLRSKFVNILFRCSICNAWTLYRFVLYFQIDNVGNPSWQAQITGIKQWTLEPPPECFYECEKSIVFAVKPGEIGLVLHLHGILLISCYKLLLM